MAANTLTAKESTGAVARLQSLDSEVLQIVNGTNCS